jgi:hypothetical protein
MKRHLRFISRLPQTSAVLLVLMAACSSVTESAHGRRNVTVTFSRAGSGAASMFPSAYVSVVDTVILTANIGESGPFITQRTRLARRDSTATFVLPLTAGDWSLSAFVVSNNGARIYSGATSLTIGDSDASADISVSAIAPVLLASPDSTNVIVDNGNIRFTVVSLYNRGTGDLLWTVPDTVPAESRTQCGAVGCVRLSAKRGVIVPSQRDSLAFIKNQVVGFKSPITFIVTSATGSISVVVRPF